MLKIYFSLFSFLPCDIIKDKPPKGDRNMEIMDAMKSRHAVRTYTDRSLSEPVKSELSSFIETCNRESGLHIQLVIDEPKAFGSLMARFGHFSGIRNYIALVGKKSPDLEETCGYWGEKIVLHAQQMGLNTCWAMTYSKVKGAFRLEKGEKMCIAIALGYGATQGTPHPSKPREAVMQADAPVPDWFLAGIDAALLAPSSFNRQGFLFSLRGRSVSGSCGKGTCGKIDLGIAKYHFEVGAGTENFLWA